MTSRSLRRRSLALVAVLAGGLLSGMLAAGPAVAGGSCHQPVADVTGTRVEMKDMCFSPTVLRIRPGETVTFVNRDQVEHPVAGANAAWVLDERAAEPSVRFGKPGVYPYFCHAHIGMVGVVVVGDGTGAPDPASVDTSPVTAAPAAVPAAPAAAPAAPAAPAEAAAPAAATAPAPGQGRIVAVIAAGALAAAGGVVLARRRRGSAGG